VSLHFAQQADMRLVRCAHFAQMPLPSFYFDEILPIDDRGGGTSHTRQPLYAITPI